MTFFKKQGVCKAVLAVQWILLAMCLQGTLGNQPEGLTSVLQAPEQLATSGLAFSSPSVLSQTALEVFLLTFPTLPTRQPTSPPRHLLGAWQPE